MEKFPPKNVEKKAHFSDPVFSDFYLVPELKTVNELWLVYY
jgi:hypothetical protein